MFKNCKFNLSLFLSFLLVLIIFCFPVSLSVKAQSVQIPNANFNSFSSIPGAVGKYKPSDWTTEQSNRFYSRTSTAVEGYGLAINAGNTVKFTTANHISIDGGKTYSLYYNAKSDGESGSALLTVYTFDLSLNQISTYTGNQTSLRSEVWADVCCEFTAEQNAVYIKIEISISAAEDSCYFDNLNLEEKVITPQLITMTGASLRLVKDSPGIRFCGRVEKTLYDEFKGKYQNVSVGILVTLRESLDSVGEFTAKAITNAGKICAEIKAEKWCNADSAENDGYYEFYCAIINVKPQNITRDMAFITYFTYAFNGINHTVYGNFDKTDNIRSVYSLASEAYLELEYYSEEQQEIINNYLELAKS